MIVLSPHTVLENNLEISQVNNFIFIEKSKQKCEKIYLVFSYYYFAYPIDWTKVHKLFAIR